MGLERFIVTFETFGGEEFGGRRFVYSVVVHYGRDKAVALATTHHPPPTTPPFIRTPRYSPSTSSSGVILG